MTFPRLIIFDCSRPRNGGDCRCLCCCCFSLFSFNICRSTREYLWVLFLFALKKPSHFEFTPPSPPWKRHLSAGDAEIFAWISLLPCNCACLSAGSYIWELSINSVQFSSVLAGGCFFSHPQWASRSSRKFLSFLCLFLSPRQDRNEFKKLAAAAIGEDKYLECYICRISTNFCIAYGGVEPVKFLISSPTLYMYEQQQLEDDIVGLCCYCRCANICAHTNGLKVFPSSSRCSALTGSCCFSFSIFITSSVGVVIEFPVAFTSP